MNNHQQQRLAILKVLYAAREAQPDKGWVTLAQLREATGPGEFALAYLEERGHLTRVVFLPHHGGRYRRRGGGVRKDHRKAFHCSHQRRQPPGFFSSALKDRFEQSP